MKKPTIALLFCLFTIPLQAATQETEWAIEVSRNPYYSEIYHLKGSDCFVNVHADGKGITLVARARLADPRDPSLATLIIQQIDIRREGEFKTVIDRRSSTAFEELLDYDTNRKIIVRTSYVDDSLAPDPFLLFAEKARTLPKEVRALFLGEYGLGRALPKKQPEAPKETR
jgi:hypothetical protein